MPRQQSYPIRAFKPVSRLEDTTDKGIALEQCQNIVLRPQDGWSGPPIYNNLWAIGVAQTAQATYRALTFSGTAIGDTAPRRATNKTVAIQIARQGKNFLLLYDLTAPLESACRGWFYLGDNGTVFTVDAGTNVFTLASHGLAVNDTVQVATTGTLPGGMAAMTNYYVKTRPSDNTFTLSATLNGDTLDITSAGSGTHSLYTAYTFTTGTPTYTVLAVGLDAAARWYGYPNQGAWFLGNGVDDNVIVQLGRTATPGIWRKAGTNAAPTAPVVSLVAPATAANTQALFVVPGYTSFSLTSTANTLQASGRLVNGMVVFQDAVTLPTPLAAATSYFVKTASANTLTIAATAGGTEIDVTADGRGDFAITSASKKVTANHNTDTFTRVAHGLVVGDGIKFSTVSGTLPGGTFTVDPATDIFTKAAHNLLVNDTVQVTTTGTLPGGMALLTTYYVKTVPNSHTFTLSATLGGTTLDITSAGSGTHTMGVIAGTKYFIQSVPSADTFIISATRGGPIFVFSSNGTGDFYYSNEAYSAASDDTSNTIIRTAPHNLAVNDAVVLSGVDVPSSTTAGVTYYVHSVPSPTTFTIKTTVAGTTARDIGTRSAGSFDYEVTGAILTVDITNNTFTRTAHNLAVNDKFTVATVFTPLTGITANRIYFIISASYSATTNITTFKLSTQQAGSAITITGNTGVLSNRLWTINGSQSLTVSALPAWKAGVNGNDCFKLAYNQLSGTVPFSSTLEGNGSSTLPYKYVVTGGTTNTFDQFVAYVAADPLVTGIISISASASRPAIFTLVTAGFSFDPTVVPYPGADASPIPDPLYVTISQGVGSGASEGYTSRTVTVYARYWDPGYQGHGYEGPSSPISNTVIIPNTANNDISITVAANAAAEGGRFTKIRLYMQFGEDADAVWKLIATADINNSGTPAAVVVGTTTVFGESDMSADQQRPLPHKFHAFAAEQMFRGGLIAYPDRLYASKVATVDEVAPEGCSLLADDYETISIPGTPAGARQVTALIATAVDLQIHTLAGFAIINPVDPAQRVYPASTAGAISQSAVTIYEGKSMYYWAADLQLRTLDTARPADFTSTVATSQFAALGALELLREYIDTDAILRQPDRTWVFPDAASQHIWMFAPGLDGAMVGFAYDLMGRGVVGPFDWPKIYATAHMEPGRPEIVFADEAGRLFVWDTSAQSDSAGNAFGTQSAFTPHATGDAMGPENDGYGYVDYDHDNDGTASRFYKAHEAILESGMLDMGQPGIRKAFQAILWRIVQDSRAFVEASFIDMAGNVETFRYGDVNDGCNCRASLMLSDSACRVKLRIIGAEMKKWAMRDMTLLFAQQGQI